MLTVYGRRSSSNVQKVLWLVAELGLEHEVIIVGGKHGGLDTPEYRAMNPHGLIPVIDDDGVIVWESHTILRYLSAKYGQGTFWSNDPAERAKIECWMDWTMGALQPHFIFGVFWGWYRTPEAERDMKAVNAALADCVKDFRLIGSMLADDGHLFGPDLTLADITIGAQLYRYFTLDLEREPTPEVEAWYTRLTQRPAYAEHVMVPYDELFGRLSF